MEKFGNKDTEQNYDLSHLKGNWEEKFVVRHFSHMTDSVGEKHEDASTNRIQVYDQKTFNDLNADRFETDSKGNQKQIPSKFAEMGLNIDVLHDPTSGDGSTLKEKKLPPKSAPKKTVPKK